LLELHPEGFGEEEGPDQVELVVFTDTVGEERLRRAFEVVSAADFADDWADRWREFHRPVQVGKLWVGPPWSEPPVDVDAVVIDPGRAFGTGAHPSTRLCLALLQELSFGSLVDVGCGSGVLAVAAATIGFSPVTAVDVEAAAIEATRANAAANGASLDVCLVAASDTVPPADVAVANISLDAVEALPRRLTVTTLVTSGYLADDVPKLDGYRHLTRRVEDGWAADVYAAR
jgi:ribosomal protein L11 methyltransferase